MNTAQLETIICSYALSPMQQGMLFHYLSEPNSGVDVEQVLFTCDKALRIQDFRAAWEQVVSRHAVLRTSFRWKMLDEPMQDVHREVTLPFAEYDWSQLSSAEQRERLDQYLASDRQLGFDLSMAPILRVMVARLSENAYKCVWSFHHILLDGRSFPTVLKEVLSAYSALSRSEEPSLQEPKPFRDYIVWLQQQKWSRSEAFWRDALKGFSAPTDLRIMRPNVAAKAHSLSKRERQTMVAEPLTSSLNSLTAKLGVSLSTLICAAWSILLSRYSGEEDVVFGIARACRKSTVSDANSIVGIFVNTVPLRVSVPPNVPVSSWLQELRGKEIGIREHEGTPLVDIQSWSEMHGGQALFDSLVMYDHLELDAIMQREWESGEFCDFELFEKAVYPLVLKAYGGDAISLKIEYDISLFDDATVSRMLGHLERLLEGMIKGGEGRIGDLLMLTAQERQTLLLDWNATNTEYPRDLCVHELFSEQARRTPEAVALIFREQRLTYAELNARANQLAHHLLALGVAPDVPVGVYLDRSLEMVIAVLAVLKAGGAYLPLDPAYPGERLQFMLQDSGTPVAITCSAWLEQVASNERRVVCVDSTNAYIDRQPVEDPVNKTRPDQLANIIYTSGSTGVPKGVEVPHRGVTRLVFGCDYAHFGPNEVFLQLAPMSFDASTFELWGALLHGATCVLFPERIPSTRRLGEVIASQHVSTLWLTSSLFNAIIDEAPHILASLRQLLTGGEALSPMHVRRALESLPETRLINGYGPTESTTFTCCYTIPRSFEPSARSVPIGRPIGNTRVYLLDDRMQPVPVGVPGELYIGGDGLARGYRKRSELTAERFVPDPFGNDSTAKLYRTGDLARFLPDGNIDFLGRLDQQVKIRGFRIEPGEIEAQLSLHPSVRQVAVILREDKPGNPRLVAYVVAGSEISASALRHYLSERVPEYMIPAAFVHIDKIPLTPNGKVDRKALPQPDKDRSDIERKFVTPRTEMEKQICEIWIEALGVNQISIYDDFFELGGHSLMTMRIISLVNDLFETDLSPIAVFECRTVAGLCELIKAKTKKLVTVLPPANASNEGLSEDGHLAMEQLASIVSKRKGHILGMDSTRPYRMRESWFCKRILAPLYRIQRRSVRSLLQFLILKLEGGDFFTVTMRRLYAQHHDLHVGHYSGMCFDVNRMQTKTRIGRYTLIYPTVVLRNADHPRNTISTHSIFYHPAFEFAKGYELPRMQLEIGNDVWIGHNAIILYPTQKIGDGAVIAAGSCVVEDVPPYAIVGGYPARVLRYRFSGETIETLLKSRWWEASLEELEPVKDLFARPIEGDKIR